MKGKKRGVKIYTAKKTPSAAEKEAWSVHNAAMDEYYKRNFTRALSLFKDVQRIVPRDDPAGIFVERSQRLIRSPPPPAWDGVIEMSMK